MMRMMLNKDDDDVQERKYIKTIIKENHENCLKGFYTLKMKISGYYHKTYRMCDVLSLADVLDNFRTTCINDYKLDPASYMTTPSLAWDAVLLKTQIKDGTVA